MAAVEVSPSAAAFSIWAQRLARAFAPKLLAEPLRLCAASRIGAACPACADWWMAWIRAGVSARNRLLSSACGLVLGGGWRSASPGFTESGLQVGEFDGFTDIVIHAGLDAGFAVAVEGIGGHGDDADAGAAGGSEVSFQLADAPGGLVTVEFGHLAVHEDSVIGEAAEGFDGFEAIGDGVGGAAEFSQLAQGDFLVYGVILREEDTESEIIVLGLAGFGVFAGEAGGMAEGVEEAGMEAGLAYWFYEVGIGADALPGMAVEVQSHGGEHDEPGLADAGGGTDFLGEV